MRDKKVFKLVIAAMFASLVCVATMVIQIPTPTKGYINIGDCIVLLSGWCLGSVYGVGAAAIGSCLADVFSGYFLYAPATFVIKGGMALIASLIYKRKENSFRKTVFSGVIAELFMAFSYFVYDWIIFGNAIVAASGIAGNLIQGTVGAVLAILILKLFQKNKTLSNFLLDFKN